MIGLHVRADSADLMRAGLPSGSPELIKSTLPALTFTRTYHIMLLELKSGFGGGDPPNKGLQRLAHQGFLLPKTTSVDESSLDELSLGCVET